MKTPIIALVLLTGLAVQAAPPVVNSAPAVAPAQNKRIAPPGNNQMNGNAINNQNQNQDNSQNNVNGNPNNGSSNPNSPDNINNPNNPNNQNNLNNNNNPNNPNSPLNPNNIQGNVNNPNNPNNINNPNNPNNYNNLNNPNNINNPNNPNSPENIQRNLNNPSQAPSPFNSLQNEGINPNTGQPFATTNSSSPNQSQSPIMAAPTISNNPAMFTNQPGRRFNNSNTNGLLNRMPAH